MLPGSKKKIHFVPSANLRGLAHPYCEQEGYKALHAPMEYETEGKLAFLVANEAGDWPLVTCAKCRQKRPKR